MPSRLKLARLGRFALDLLSSQGWGLVDPFTLINI
jgi:hypothetical protein